MEPYPYADPGSLLADGGMVVALDEVTDPRNLGAVARSAEVAGAAGLVIPERRSVGVNATVAKTSAGAVEHLPVARVRNLADWLEEAKKQGAWVYGADAGGDSVYTDTDLTGPLVLVLGSEGKGLRPRVAATCDAIVSIPVRGKVDSLNVSVAAAVLLFEAARQRAGR